MYFTYTLTRWRNQKEFIERSITEKIFFISSYSFVELKSISLKEFLVELVWTLLARIKLYRKSNVSIDETPVKVSSTTRSK